MSNQIAIKLRVRFIFEFQSTQRELVANNQMQFRFEKSASKYEHCIAKLLLDIIDQLYWPWFSILCVGQCCKTFEKSYRSPIQFQYEFDSSRCWLYFFLHTKDVEHNFCTQVSNGTLAHITCLFTSRIVDPFQPGFLLISRWF